MKKVTDKHFKKLIYDINRKPFKWKSVLKYNLSKVWYGVSWLTDLTLHLSSSLIHPQTKVILWLRNLSTNIVCAFPCSPCDRNLRDVELISCRLRRVEPLCRLPGSALQQLAMCGFYEDLEKGVTRKWHYYINYVHQNNALPIHVNLHSCFLYAFILVLFPFYLIIISNMFFIFIFCFFFRSSFQFFAPGNKDASGMPYWVARWRCDTMRTQMPMER